MHLELLTIGNELLLGQTVDTNGAELARALGAIGVRVVRRTTVGDDYGAIQQAVRDALARTGAVLTTGGLGPTRDDISKHAVADLAGLPLEFRDEVWNQVLERYRRFNRAPAESNRSQAEVPRGAVALHNRWGTAPGLWIEVPEPEQGLVIMLPGVPSEMRKLLEHEVLPRLAARAEGLVVRSRMLRTTGVPESTLAEAIGNIEAEIRPLTLAYLPSADGVDLRITAWGLAGPDADVQLRMAMDAIRARVPAAIYGEDGTDLAAVVLARARECGLTITTAESCTGGLVGARLTAIPGASDVYLGGVVAYANALKEGALEVPAELIAAHGAVSEEVARAMAEGARRRFGAGLAVSVTGIAGPDGGTPEKPVGGVWIATAGSDGTLAAGHRFGGDRNEVRARSAQAALWLLARRLEPR